MAFARQCTIYITSRLSFGLMMLVLLIGAVTESHAAACHTYMPGDAVPSGFGAPYSFFTNTLLFSASCDTDGSVSLEAGDNTAPLSSPSPYVYSTGYLYLDQEWQTFNFSCGDPRPTWCPRYAFADISIEEPGTYFAIAYTCEQIDDDWKCGCRDAACTQPGWQVQLLQVSRAAENSLDDPDSAAAAYCEGLTGNALQSCQEKYETTAELRTKIAASERGMIPLIVRVTGNERAATTDEELAQVRARLDAVIEDLPDDDISNVKRMRLYPMFAVTVNAEGLRALIRHPDVAAIQEDEPTGFGF